MNYTQRERVAVIIACVLMLLYIIVSLVSVKSNGWTIPGTLLLCIIAVNFLLALFIETNKKLTALVCILVGVLSMILISGTIFWFALILTLYGIYLLLLIYMYR